MNVEAAIKTNPLYWLAGVVSAIVLTTLSVESRYAKAEDVIRAKQELKEEMQKHRTYTDLGFLKQRKALLEDKVFEFEAKREEKKLGASDLRLLIRFRSELEDLNRELRDRR